MIVRNVPHQAATPQPPRISAAVARIARHYASAYDRIGDVLGPSSLLDAALAERIGALTQCPRAEDPISRESVMRAASRVRELVEPLAATVGVIELHDVRAAALGVDLGAIVSECELIAAA